MKKILILSANPRNIQQLRLNEEVRKINEALKLSKNRDNFTIITKSAVRVSDLRRELLEHQPNTDFSRQVWKHLYSKGFRLQHYYQ